MDGLVWRGVTQLTAVGSSANPIQGSASRPALKPAGKFGGEFEAVAKECEPWHRSGWTVTSTAATMGGNQLGKTKGKRLNTAANAGGSVTGRR